MHRRLLLGLLLSCRGPSEPACADARGEFPGELKLSACSDGKQRKVSCEAQGDDDWMCACLVDDKLGRSFNWPRKVPAQKVTEDRRAVLERVVRSCHWSLATR